MKPRLRGGPGPLGAVAPWDRGDRGGRTLIIEEFCDAADCIFR